MKLDPENYENYVGYKIKLNPTKEQKELFNKYFGVSRFVYNIAKDMFEYSYFANDHQPSFIDLNNEFTKLRNEDKYKWLQEYDIGSLKLSLKDLHNGYTKYFIGLNNNPKYRTLKRSTKQFPIRSERLSITENYARIPSIGEVSCSNSYGDNIIGTGYKDRIDKSLSYLKYTSARVIFNGIDYYLSFSLPKDQNHNINSYKNYGGNIQWQQKSYSKAIGIDVGLKRDKWMVDSTGYTLERPDNTRIYKKIDDLERKLMRQRDINKNREPRLFKDRKKPVNGISKNMQKTKAKINKCYKKITNRRKNTIYNYCNKLLDLKPKTVVFESISVSKNMIVYDNNVHIKIKKGINHLVEEAALYDSIKTIERKLMSNGIKVIYADPNYPSSQLCSCCGYRQKIGKHKIYVCPECGTVINRDYNAALNLAKLADLICPVKRIS